MPDNYSDRTLALTDVVETAQGATGDVNPDNLAVREETLQAVGVTLQARADTIDAKQATIQLKADTGQIKTDTAQIKTETGQIKTDTAQIKTETGQIKTETGQLKTDTQALVVAATAQAGIATTQAGIAQNAVATGRVTKDTQPQLDASLNYPAGAQGEVIADPGPVTNTTGNGLYIKVGASGSGSWVKRANTTLTAVASRVDQTATYDDVSGERVRLYSFDTAADTLYPIAFAETATGVIPVEGYDLDGAHRFFNELKGEGFAYSVDRHLRANLGAPAQAFLFDTAAGGKIPIGLLAQLQGSADLFAPIEFNTATGLVEVNGLDGGAGARMGTRYSVSYRQAGGLQQIRSRRLSDLKEFVLTSTGDNTDASLTSDQGAVTFTRTLAGVRSELYVPVEGGAANPVNALDGIVAIGDSLTQINNGAAPGTQWGDIVATAAFGASNPTTLQRVATGGRSAAQQAAVLGSAPGSVVIQGGQIPAATTPVVITNFTPPLNSVNVSGAHDYSYKGAIAGVPGVFAFDSDGNGGTGAYSFTRTNAGSAVVVPAGTPFIPTFDYDIKNYILITRLGTNGFTDIPGTVAAIQTMVDWHKPLNKKILITSAVNRTTYNPVDNLSFYNTFIALNAAYAANWPKYYVNTRTPPTPEEMAAINYPPTDESIRITLNGYQPNTTGLSAQDINDISKDTIPSGMRVDGLHENRYGEALYALRIIRAMTARGWI